MNVWEGVIEIYVYISLCISVLGHNVGNIIFVSMSQLRRIGCASCEVESKDKLCAMTYSCAWSHKIDSPVQPSCFLH